MFSNYMNKRDRSHACREPQSLCTSHDGRSLRESKDPVSERCTKRELLFALKNVALYCSDTLLGDQAASDFDVTTKDRAAELGNESKSKCVCVGVCACVRVCECVYVEMFLQKRGCLLEKTRGSFGLIVTL